MKKYSVMTRALVGYIMVTLMFHYSVSLIGIFRTSFGVERCKVNFKPKSFSFVRSYLHGD